MEDIGVMMTGIEADHGEYAAANQKYH